MGFFLFCLWEAVRLYFFYFGEIPYSLINDEKNALKAS